MKKFYEEVDKNNREKMIEFLKKHYRYYTMNPWNLSTSYANCLKIHALELNNEIEDKLYELLDVKEFYDDLNFIVEDFDANHFYQYQAGFNGRSGGYLVLYMGGKKDDKVYSQPGLGIDESEDFEGEEWDNNALKERVELVQDFDQLCDDIVAQSVSLAENYTIEEKEIMTPKKIKVLVEKEN